MKEESKGHEEDLNKEEAENAGKQEQENEEVVEEVVAEVIEEKESEEEKSANEPENQDIPDSFASLEDAMKVIAALQVKLHNANQIVEVSKDKELRLQAEFDNFRKRKTKEAADSIRFANQDLLKTLLPVLDNFGRTLDAIEKTDNLASIKEGIAMVDSSLHRQLNKIGLEPIVAKGKEFDIDFHEAISSIPIDDEEMKGKVIEEVEKGYKFKDRVIRFSKVIVGE